MYVWNAGKLAVRREQIRKGDKVVRHRRITRIQVASLGYSFHTFWQCNPRIAASLNVEHDVQLVCSYVREALMLSDCVGSAKHHIFRFVQHNDTGDKEVDSFLPLIFDFTDRTTAAFENIIAEVHYMNCQTEYQLHQLLKPTKNLCTHCFGVSCETLQTKCFRLNFS